MWRPRHTGAIDSIPTRFWRFSPGNAIVLELLRKDQEAQIIAQRRAKAIVAVGKRLGLAGFVVAAAKIPRNQRVPDVRGWLTYGRSSRKKRNASVCPGAGCAFLVWFVAFLAVGGEWFAMWQSQVWNGQQAAFRILASILLVLIFVAQPDSEL